MKLVYIREEEHLCAECDSLWEGNFIQYKCGCDCCNVTICVECINTQGGVKLGNCVCEEEPEYINLKEYLENKKNDEEKEGTLNGH